MVHFNHGWWLFPVGSQKVSNFLDYSIPNFSQSKCDSWGVGGGDSGRIESVHNLIVVPDIRMGLRNIDAMLIHSFYFIEYRFPAGRLIVSVRKVDEWAD